MIEDLETIGYGGSAASTGYTVTDDLDAYREPGLLPQVALAAGLGTAVGICLVEAYDHVLEGCAKTTASLAYIDGHLAEYESEIIEYMAEQAVDHQLFSDTNDMSGDIHRHVWDLAKGDGGITGEEARLLIRLGLLR